MKLFFDKPMPPNFDRMFKINIWKLRGIKTNKQWVIKTNKRKYMSFVSVNLSQLLFLMSSVLISILRFNKPISKINQM